MQNATIPDGIPESLVSAEAILTIVEQVIQKMLDEIFQTK